MKHILAVCTFAFIATTSQAVEFNGIEIPETRPGSDQQTELKLVDASSQNYYYIDNAYVGAVYQSDTSTSPERVEFIVNSERLSGRAIGVSLYENMALQLEWEQYEALESRMSSLVKMLDTKLEQGDRIVMTYSDEAGAEIFVKEEYKGSIESKALFKLATRSWLLQDGTANPSAGIAHNTKASTAEAAL